MYYISGQSGKRLPVEAPLDPVLCHEEADPGAQFEGVVRLHAGVGNCRETQGQGYAFTH